jgi:hypothetical protein
MSRMIVINHVTLDGVMPAPSRQAGPTRIAVAAGRRPTTTPSWGRR